MTTTQQQISQIAEQAGVTEKTVESLANFIARESEGAEDLIGQREWMEACTEDWLRRQRFMAHSASTRRRDHCLLILDEVRRCEAA